jgi:hypothetical protein
MTALRVAWGLSAAFIVAIAAWAGWAATGQVGGILIDTRGRYSLTRFQNSTTGLDLGFYAARSYSLMRPQRTGRRLIRFPGWPAAACPDAH